MELVQEQLNRVRDWNEAKTQLRYWMERESNLRDDLVRELFNPNQQEGTETIDIHSDWQLKAVKKLNYSLNNEDGEVSAICAQLPLTIARTIVRWKPDLNLQAFRRADEYTRSLFAPVLSIKPAKPSLELVPPK